MRRTIALALAAAAAALDPSWPVVTETYIIDGRNATLSVRRGEDALVVAEAFVTAHGLRNGHVECGTGVSEERCIIDTVAATLERRLVAYELLDGLQGRYWDVAGMLRGHGYSKHKEQLLYRGVLRRLLFDAGAPYDASKCAALLGTSCAGLARAATAALRAAAAADGGRFAPAAHVLANVLTDLSEFEGSALGAHTEAAAAMAATLAVRARSLQEHAGAAAAAADDAAAYVVPAVPAAGLRLRAVTVASHDKKELQWLRASAAAAGVELTVLGLGQPWRGLGSKVTAVRTWLADVAADDVVMLVDAYDVLLFPSASPEAFLGRFREFGAPLLFGAERKCSPDKGAAAAYAPLGSGEAFRFLNSGQYMGYAAAVKAMLDEVDLDLALHYAHRGADPLEVDDQRWFTRFFLANEPSGRVALDRGAKVFSTTLEVEPEDILVTPNPVAVRSALTGSDPLLMHGNGYGRATWYDAVARLRALGWPPASQAEL